MKRFGMLVMAMGLMCSVTAVASAAESAAGAKKSCGVCNAAESTTSYGAHAAGTLGRGVANGVLCWTELFAQPIAAGKAHENVLVGVGKGVGYTIKRLVFGVGEILTFWVPEGKMTIAHDCALGVMGMVDR